MAKYEVTLEKVFGACIRRTITVEGENLEEAIDNAKDDGSTWATAYQNVTVDNLSDDYEWGSIIVDGEIIQYTNFGHDLLNDAIKMQWDSSWLAGPTYEGNN